MNTATILVVDDEPQLRRAMKATLTDLGYSVMEAGGAFRRTLRGSEEGARAVPPRLLHKSFEYHKLPLFEIS